LEPELATLPLPPQPMNFLGLLTRKPPGFPKELDCSGKMDSGMMKFIVMREEKVPHLWTLLLCFD